MKHALLEYEENGYHDSYFYVVYFDDVANTIGSRMIGATAFAGGNYGDVHRHEKVVPADVLEKARVALSDLIFNLIKVAEHNDVMTPGVARHGDVMRVLINNGPRSKSVYSAGTVGEVFWSGAFGTFYRNGYNKPNRENTRLGLRLNDGSTVFVPLKACRLDREPLTDTELRARAEALSREYNFGAAISGYTWASEVFFRRPGQKPSPSIQGAGVAA